MALITTVTPHADPPASSQDGAAGPFAGAGTVVRKSTNLIDITALGTDLSGATTVASGDVILPATADAGVRKRVVFLKSTCNQAVHVALQFTPPSGSANAAITFLDIALAVGSTNPQTALITSAGAASADTGSAAPTVTGSVALLDTPADDIRAVAYAATPPTSGSIFLDIVEYSS